MNVRVGEDDRHPQRSRADVIHSEALEDVGPVLIEQLDVDAGGCAG
jgi:hypothetical protein